MFLGVPRFGDGDKKMDVQDCVCVLLDLCISVFCLCDTKVFKILETYDLSKMHLSGFVNDVEVAERPIN